ncbi:MAG: hypothetical protein ACE5IL_17210 [Myxococcota bacterium]
MRANPPNRPVLTGRELHERFRAVRGRRGGESWRIRVHRAISWLEQAEELPPEQQDLRFVALWIAFNSLYGEWDRDEHQPVRDASSRRRLAARLVDLDAPRVEWLLRGSRSTLKSVLSSRYLLADYWKDPDDEKRWTRHFEDARRLQRNLDGEQILRVLQQTLHRLTVLRGQVFHGQSTRGSRLNRAVVRPCGQLLASFVPVFIEIVLEEGADDEWGPVGFPPSR